MDATVKLTIVGGGSQYVAADVTIDGKTRRILKTRDQWLRKDTDDALDDEQVLRQVENNVATYLATEQAILEKEAKQLDWSSAALAVSSKGFKV